MVDTIDRMGMLISFQYVPHDTAKLIELQGGNDAFITRLNWIFDEVLYALIGGIVVNRGDG